VCFRHRAASGNIKVGDDVGGEIIGGFQKTIVLLSGSRVTNPCPQ